MMKSITYQKLRQEEIGLDLLDTFNRYQEVKRCWRKDGNQWILKDISFTEDWNAKKKYAVAIGLQECIAKNGFVFGAFIDCKLIGFSSLSSDFFGINSEYLEMQMIHVSAEYRGKGIGKKLFELIVDSAKSLGARKLYISAQSSEESQAFYKAVGCVEAKEINQTIAENEPYDCQLEYVI